jgi:rhodanese-related sulfurtransferase
MNTVTPQELKAKIDNKENFQLIDIREEYEFEDYNLGGTNIPMDNIFNSLDQIATDKEVIFICNSGKRSAAIIHTLKRKLQLEKLYSVSGGVSEYQELA